MALTPDTLAEMYESAPDPPPLNGLRELDWAAVCDAYGPATRVPAYLRALMSDDPDHREFAYEILFERIWHQGNIYSATAAAVTFLYNLLEADGPQDKAAVAHLIAAIAVGVPSFARCESDPEEAALWEGILRKAGRSLQAEMAEGRVVAAEVRLAVVQRLDVLYPYLRHPEPEIRRSVAAAVGVFPEIVDRVLPDLEVALRDETDKYARAALAEVIERRTRPK